MVRVLLLAVLGGGPVAATPTVDPLWHRFESFKRKYQISFDSQEEEAHRFSVFKNNMVVAEEMQQKQDTTENKHGGTARFGETKFSHLTQAEFKEKYLSGLRIEGDRAKRFDRKKEDSEFSSSDSKDDLTTIDWRKFPGAISYVRNQGQCGSCWSHAAAQQVQVAEVVLLYII